MLKAIKILLNGILLYHVANVGVFDVSYISMNRFKELPDKNKYVHFIYDKDDVCVLFVRVDNVTAYVDPYGGHENVYGYDTVHVRNTFKIDTLDVKEIVNICYAYALLLSRGVRMEYIMKLLEGQTQKTVISGLCYFARLNGSNIAEADTCKNWSLRIQRDNLAIQLNTSITGKPKELPGRKPSKGFTRDAAQRKSDSRNVKKPDRMKRNMNPNKHKLRNLNKKNLLSLDVRQSIQDELFKKDFPPAEYQLSAKDKKELVASCRRNMSDLPTELTQDELEQMMPSTDTSEIAIEDVNRYETENVNQTDETEIEQDIIDPDQPGRSDGAPAEMCPLYICYDSDSDLDAELYQ